MKAIITVGLEFGDEGKGLATDHHAAPYGADALVVRFNGGAQAGHTVLTPDGRRHVFSHVGAGAFTGAATYLSRFFVCHPMLLQRELAALRALGAAPRILVDRACMVTTPFDVMVNQALEAARGSGRHGSCGLGFGETIEREEVGGIALRAGALVDEGRLLARLRRIRVEYLPRRLSALGIDALPAAARDDGLIERFVDDLRRFVAAVELVDLRVLREQRALLFEGAQGLLLDMDRGHFPHVTRSSTGLTNVLALAREAGLTDLDVSYVSRCYATRHGAGPMRHELAEPPFPGLVDRTNEANRWQGRLRYGWLDVDWIARAVRTDLADARNLRVRAEWIVTWMDRVEGALPYVVDGRRVAGTGESLAAALAARAGIVPTRLAFGETRDAIVEGPGACTALVA